MFNEGQEVWRMYPDYPFIEASNFGRVRIKDRTTLRSNGVKYHTKGRILKQRDNGHGYMYVSFSVNGKIIYLYVHRIVATCFVPNPDNLPEINHIDCNRANNRLDNLEWCTHQENMAYSNKLGHMINGNPGHPVIAVNPETAEVFWFESQREAGRQLGVYQSNIRSVLKGRYIQTGGYWFCDADENAIEKVRAKFGDEVANKVERLMSKN